LYRGRLFFLQIVGGKHTLVSRILPLLPPHKTYVEVFGGGAPLLLNKPRSEIEVYNDVDGLLVNLFLVVRDHALELQRRLEALPDSREIYEKFRSEPWPEDSIERASRFYYLQRLSFSGLLNRGWRFSTVRDHAGEWISSVEMLPLVMARLRQALIDRVDFRTCFKNYDRPDTLFFCDPPYMGQKLYSHSFVGKDHLDLAEILHSIKGKWILTYDDYPKVRRLYSGFPTIATLSQKNSARVRDQRRRIRFGELIIANFPLEEPTCLPETIFRTRGPKIPGVRPPSRSQKIKVLSDLRKE